MANAQKPPEKKVEKVVQGEVVVRKKSTLAKIRDTFISEDADKVGSYILLDVLVPRIKMAIVDIIKSSADMIFGTKGTSQTTGTKYTYGGTPYVTYSSSGVKKQPEPSRAERDMWDFSFVEFSRLAKAEDNRDDADKVISEMFNLIDQYGQASVADLCDIIGAKWEFTANDYGWKDLRGVVPIKIPGTDGYYLRFPRAIPLDKN